jgi:hypothetical protein
MVRVRIESETKGQSMCEVGGMCVCKCLFFVAGNCCNSLFYVVGIDVSAYFCVTIITIRQDG